MAFVQTPGLSCITGIIISQDEFSVAKVVKYKRCGQM